MNLLHQAQWESGMEKIAPAHTRHIIAMYNSVQHLCEFYLGAVVRDTLNINNLKVI